MSHEAIPTRRKVCALLGGPKPIQTRRVQKARLLCAPPVLRAMPWPQVAEAIGVDGVLVDLSDTTPALQ
jgi:hypothetical protein